MYVQTFNMFIPLAAKLFNLNFHPLEIVSRWRDPQLQVSDNYSDLTKCRSNNFKYCWLMSLCIFKRFRSWYVMCWYKMQKKRIWTAPVFKRLRHGVSHWEVLLDNHVNINRMIFLRLRFNPLSPHDALKHHFTSLKTDLISLQQRVLERKFPWNWFTNTWQFSLIFKPH